MSSFDLDFVDEKSRAGSEFMFRIAQELQRAFLSEKKSRKLTQQAIANDLDTSRAVINRQLQGLENIGARRIGELFWAMGWEPRFEAHPLPKGANDKPMGAVPREPNIDKSEGRGSALDNLQKELPAKQLPSIEEAIQASKKQSRDENYRL